MIEVRIIGWHVDPGPTTVCWYCSNLADVVIMTPINNTAISSCDECLAQHDVLKDKFYDAYERFKIGRNRRKNMPYNERA